MNNPRHSFTVLLVIVSILAVGVYTAFAQAENPISDAPAVSLGTQFTYQGRLESSGSPASGSHDFEFRLFDAAAGGAQVGNTQTLAALAVSQGYFTAVLDFGLAFDNQARWLEVSVRPAGGGAYTILSPRQPVQATPQAQYSLKAPWAGLTGVPAGFADGIDHDTLYSAGTGLALSGGQFSLSATYRLPQGCANGQVAAWNGAGWVCAADSDTTYAAGTGLSLSGTTFNADTAYLQRRVTASCAAGSSIRVVNEDGSVVCEPDDSGGAGNAWLLAGNGGTNPSTDFLGTTDNQPLEMRVNNSRILRLEPNDLAPNVFGGHSSNDITSGVYGATIFGGGFPFANTQLVPNIVTDRFGTISGGYGNTAGDNAGTIHDAALSVIGGGTRNTASGQFSTIDGGYFNLASAELTSIGGGQNNIASATGSTVGGGTQNIASGTSLIWAIIGSTVAGGSTNTADAAFATIGGGYGHQATSQYNTIAGGYTNTTSNDGATVGGGQFNNTSGINAVISGGFQNTASGIQAIVPGGYQSSASGNYTLAAGTQAKAIYDGSFVWADGNPFDFSSQANNTFNVRSTGGYRLVAGIDGAGVVTWKCSFVNGGSWACSSDRNLKENFTNVDSQEILEKVSKLAVQTWNAIGTDPQVKHLGPTAQDFYAAFGLGDSDTSINTIDLDGVALVAIQELHRQAQVKDAAIHRLESQNSTLQEQVADLQAKNDAFEQRLAALEQASTSQRGAPSSTNPIAYLSLPMLGIGLVLAGKKLYGSRRGESS